MYIKKTVNVENIICWNFLSSSLVCTYAIFNHEVDRLNINGDVHCNLISIRWIRMLLYQS